MNANYHTLRVPNWITSTAISAIATLTNRGATRIESVRKKNSRILIGSKRSTELTQGLHTNDSLWKYSLACAHHNLLLCSSIAWSHRKMVLSNTAKGSLLIKFRTSQPNVQMHASLCSQPFKIFWIFYWFRNSCCGAHRLSAPDLGSPAAMNKIHCAAN